MFHWYRLVGAASDGARVLEPGVRAGKPGSAGARARGDQHRALQAPGRPRGGLRGARGRVRRIGAQLGRMGVRPMTSGLALLRARGHVLDAEPAAMARPEPGASSARAPEALPDWRRDGDLAASGRLNDLAYPLGDRFVLARAPAACRRRRCARLPRQHGRRARWAASSRSTTRATPGRARRGGTGGARPGDCGQAAARTPSPTRPSAAARSTTLIATKLGRPVYERPGTLVRSRPDVGAPARAAPTYLSETFSSNMTSLSSVRCTGHLAAICISRSRWSSGSSLGICTSITKRVGEPRWAGS